MKAAYTNKYDIHMKTHHYNNINVTDIAQLFAKAYNRVTSKEKGLNVF